LLLVHRTVTPIIGSPNWSRILAFSATTCPAMIVALLGTTVSPFGREGVLGGGLNGSLQALAAAMVTAVTKRARVVAAIVTSGGSSVPQRDIALSTDLDITPRA
jgi:hypothetical protein